MIEDNEMFSAAYMTQTVMFVNSLFVMYISYLHFQVKMVEAVMSAEPTEVS